MIVTNTEPIAGYRIVEIRGLVQGNTVRAKHAGRDIAASFKNLIGGELKGYTELLTESRRQAIERMMSQAQQLGANAVVNVRLVLCTASGGMVFAIVKNLVYLQIYIFEPTPEIVRW